jgi:hypothetical protein
MAQGAGRALLRRAAQLLAAPPARGAWELGAAAAPLGARSLSAAAGAPGSAAASAWRGSAAAHAAAQCPPGAPGAARGLRCSAAARDLGRDGGAAAAPPGDARADAAWLADAPVPRRAGRDLLAEVQGMSRKHQQCVRRAPPQPRPRG